jgi:hypothetical protein
MTLQHQVFVSFSEEDTERVRPLVEVLRSQGWDVWWYQDEKLKLGENIHGAVEEALETARAAVVVWSKHSCASKWVKSEAERARELGTFVPVRIDEGRIPVPFNLDRTADLRDWRGKLDHPGYKTLVNSLSQLAGPTAHVENGAQKGEKDGEKLREARSKVQPRRTMLAITGISIAIGILIAVLGCLPCLSQNGPIMLALFVSSVVLGLFYFLTWRGSQVAHTILVILTLVFLSLGFVLVAAVAGASRPSALLTGMAVGALVVGLTGIPLLIALVRGAGKRGAGTQAAAR